MVDNIPITAGSGTVVRTDEVASAHFQRIKIDVGAEGAEALLSSVNPIPVSIVADAVGSKTDTDDGSVAAAQADIALVLAMRYLFNGTAWVRGGYTPVKRISTADTNAASIKASAGLLGMCVVENINASPRYLKFYNKASVPTVGTDTPVLTFLVPGSTTGGGVAVPIPEAGLAFSLGIALALTTGMADADTGAVAAGDLVINLGYL